MDKKIPLQVVILIRGIFLKYCNKSKPLYPIFFRRIFIATVKAAHPNQIVFLGFEFIYSSQYPKGFIFALTGDPLFCR